MKQQQTIAIAVVVVIVIVVGIILAVTQWSGPEPPSEASATVGAIKDSRIDKDSLEIVTLSRDEWAKLDKQGGMFQNPNTKKYTMCEILICSHCGKQIPRPAIEVGPGESEAVATEEIQKTYTCPYCKKTPDFSYIPAAAAEEEKK